MTSLKEVTVKGRFLNSASTVKALKAITSLIEEYGLGAYGSGTTIDKIVVECVFPERNISTGDSAHAVVEIKTRCRYVAADIVSLFQ